LQAFFDGIDDPGVLLASLHVDPRESILKVSDEDVRLFERLGYASEALVLFELQQVEIQVRVVYGHRSHAFHGLRAKRL
jgi:hypothetical protein